MTIKEAREIKRINAVANAIEEAQLEANLNTINKLAAQYIHGTITAQEFNERVRVTL